VATAALAVAVVLPNASAFAFLPAASTSTSTTRLHGGSTGYATSLEGKKATVERVRELLQGSEMIFSVPAGSLTVSQQQKLCGSVPAGTTVKVVKNKLMQRAVEGTAYEVVASSSSSPSSSLLKGPNMWFFIGDDIRGTMTAYKEFLKAEGKRESHPVLGGVVESTLYDAAGIEAIGNLPSKNELYAKIAASIQAVPTKVARAVKAPGSKLARAVKLATDKQRGDGGSE
jgi:large subunit ribosomal protein L10